MNVLSYKTKVRKLFIIKLSSPPVCRLLPRIVVSLNKSTHQARSGFQVLGSRLAAMPRRRNCTFMIASGLSCKEETEVRTRCGGRTSWACLALLPAWARTVPSAGAIRCFGRRGRTFVVPQDAHVVQHARARLSDLALRLSILRRNSSRRRGREPQPTIPSRDPNNPPGRLRCPQAKAALNSTVAGNSS